jgi:hypothetical protein
MAAVSFSIKRGDDGFKISSFTVGALAPNANDFEFRIASLDGQSHVMTRKDAVIALKAITRAIESGALYSNAPPL